jgi:hypothetical protein
MRTATTPLHTIAAEAATPDETTYGSIRGISDVRIWFAPGYYAYSTDARIADKLVQLGRLLWTARTKEYYRQKSLKLNRIVRGESRPMTPAQQRRQDARNNIVARGRSSDGTVELEAVGLYRWSAVVAPGTVARVPEDVFCASASEAALKLVEQHVNKMQWVWHQDYS